MSRINIYGLIESDAHAWYRPYADADRVTFPGDIRDALAAADTASDIDLFIDSPGGYVDGGRSMLVALGDWANANGRKINVTVGGMACSMAAVLAISFTGTVSVHDVSMMMLHGARVSLWDDMVADQLRDAADSLDTINDFMVRAIVRRTGKSEADARAMVSGTKETYLGGPDIVASGLADAVVEEANLPAADLHVPAESDVFALAKNLSTGTDAGLTLAAVACAAFAKKQKGNTMDGKKAPAVASAAEPVTVPAEPVAETKAKPTAVEPAAEPAAKPAAEPATPAAAPAAAPAAEPASAPAADDAAAEALKSAVEKAVADAVGPLNEKLMALQAENAELKNRAAAAEGALAGMKAGQIQKALTPSDGKAAASRGASMLAWREAVQACGGSIVAAKAAHPELYTAVCAAN